MQGIPAAIGVSATREYHVNSLAVPRKAKEAIGGITKLTHTDGILFFPFPLRQSAPLLDFSKLLIGIMTAAL